MGAVGYGWVWLGWVWLERTCKTSKVDFHIVWAQVIQSSTWRSFKGGGCQGAPCVKYGQAGWEANLDHMKLIDWRNVHDFSSEKFSVGS